MSGFGDSFLRQHYATVAGLGDKLGEISGLIEREKFRPILKDMYRDTKEEGGRPHYDEILGSAETGGLFEILGRFFGKSCFGKQSFYKTGFYVCHHVSDPKTDPANLLDDGGRIIYINYHANNYKIIISGLINP